VNGKKAHQVDELLIKAVDIICDIVVLYQKADNEEKGLLLVRRTPKNYILKNCNIEPLGWVNYAPLYT
jgi:hypothetical protein